MDATDCKLNAINVEALPFPGFPTDLQPFACVYANACEGISHIKDMIFSERFSLLNEIRSMGLSYESMFAKVIVKGKQKLGGSLLEGADIRMATALVMAALMADGESKIYGLYHIFRGYDNFVQKLRTLGADIEIQYDENDLKDDLSECV